MIDNYSFRSYYLERCRNYEKSPRDLDDEGADELEEIDEESAELVQQYSALWPGG